MSTSIIKKALNLLGLEVKDKITGIKGVVVSTSFDLYGCVQLLINRGLDKAGGQRDNVWMDMNRLEVLSRKRKISLPLFLTKTDEGASEKSKYDSQPPL